MAISGDWDRRISRRTLLKTGGSFAASVALAALASERAFGQASFDSYPFTLGVASGDPTPKGFVLWTRLAPNPLLVGGGLPAEPFEVGYELARDEDFRHIERYGTTVALPDEAHSVRVELDELPPEREYWYRFKAGNEISPVGRTRTGPPGNSMVDAVTFAFVSCQNFADGYFTPYADLDLDPDVPIEQVRARRAAAYRAYWEHMPLARARKPEGPDLQLYRRFRWGKLATFNVLDGRQYRSDQPAVCTADQRDPSGYCPSDLSAERTMLGAEQRDWLLEDLATTKARWNVLAQQTGFAPFNRATGGAPPNYSVSGSTAGPDSWDGYVADRQRILDWLVEQETSNPVVLTGDSHQNWVRNVPADFRDLSSGPVATEFMGTSISTNGDPAADNAFTRYRDDPNNPHIILRNNNRGYVRCTLTPDLWTSEYRVVTTVRQPGASTSTLAAFAIEDGRPGAVQV